MAAAVKSGLLDDVATALWFAYQNGNTSSDRDHPCTGDYHCIACKVLEELADRFDEHVVAASCVAESFYGEGTSIDPMPGEEGRILPFLGLEFGAQFDEYRKRHLLSEEEIQAAAERWEREKSAAASCSGHQLNRRDRERENLLVPGRPLETSPTL